MTDLFRLQMLKWEKSDFSKTISSLSHKIETANKEIKSVHDSMLKFQEDPKLYCDNYRDNLQKDLNNLQKDLNNFNKHIKREKEASSLKLPKNYWGDKTKLISMQNEQKQLIKTLEEFNQSPLEYMNKLLHNKIKRLEEDRNADLLKKLLHEFDLYKTELQINTLNQKGLESKSYQDELKYLKSLNNEEKLKKFQEFLLTKELKICNYQLKIYSKTSNVSYQQIQKEIKSINDQLSRIKNQSDQEYLNDRIKLCADETKDHVDKKNPNDAKNKAPDKQEDNCIESESDSNDATDSGNQNDLTSNTEYSIVGSV